MSAHANNNSGATNQLIGSLSLRYRAVFGATARAADSELSQYFRSSSSRMSRVARLIVYRAGGLDRTGTGAARPSAAKSSGRSRSGGERSLAAAESARRSLGRPERRAVSVAVGVALAPSPSPWPSRLDDNINSGSSRCVTVRLGAARSVGSGRGRARICMLLARCSARGPDANPNSKR